MNDRVTCITEFVRKASRFINDNSKNKNMLEHDLEKLLTKFLSRMNLVTREEFDVQVAVLQKAKDKMKILEDSIKSTNSSRTD